MQNADAFGLSSTPRGVRLRLLGSIHSDGAHAKTTFRNCAANKGLGMSHHYAEAVSVVLGLVSVSRTAFYQFQRHMHDSCAGARRHATSAFPEDRQHRPVLRQYLRSQLLKSALTRNQRVMTEQCPTDSKPLVFVNNSEGHLRLSGLYKNHPA
jgi:hypothetical protein